MTPHRTPIAVFAYRRPDHVRRMLASLAQCAGLDSCDVHIFCDGAKNPADADAVAATRAVVRKWAATHGANAVERTGNLGLAKSIVSAVSDLVEHHGRVIVIEDDLILSRDFLSFMLAGLDRYEDEERILQISGFAFTTGHPTETDAAFLPHASTWGWATWRRAWRHFRWEPQGVDAITNKSVERRFNLDDAYPYSTLLVERLAGRNDSWGILWYWSMFRANGLVIFPRESLVCVGGADGSGTHCREGSHEAGMQTLGTIRPGGLAWPEAVTCDEDLWRAVKEHLRNTRPGSSRKRNWLAKLSSWMQPARSPGA